ncbi:unnamed protein product [Lactuca saligna]|uniref:ATP-dependent Clp protease proteolytic subunit n=1 Tax=Lactuca saligna TaxID=75948 RepID=A0AA35YVJ6_LACSI|nr:unnamed protein product [Lactuca saligna]
MLTFFNSLRILQIQRSIMKQPGPTFGKVQMVKVMLLFLKLALEIEVKELIRSHCYVAFSCMIQQPRVPSSGLMTNNDVLICAKESVEIVTQVMKRPFYMHSTKAKEFGVIDKILLHG